MTLEKKLGAFFGLTNDIRLNHANLFSVWQDLSFFYFWFLLYGVRIEEIEDTDERSV